MADSSVDCEIARERLLPDALPDVVWQEPPPVETNGPGARHFSLLHQARIVAKLADNPGRWALLLRSVNGASLHGWGKQYGVEITRRTSGNGFDVYVRMPREGEEPCTPPGQEVDRG